MPTPVPKINRSYYTLTDQQHAERARKAGKAGQTPEARAQRLVRDWPSLSLDQKPASAPCYAPSATKRLPGNATASGTGTWGSQQSDDQC